MTEEIKKETIEAVKQRTISHLHEYGLLDMAAKKKTTKKKPVKVAYGNGLKMRKGDKKPKKA